MKYEGDQQSNHAHGIVDRPLVLLLHRAFVSIERVAVEGSHTTGSRRRLDYTHVVGLWTTPGKCAPDYGPQGQLYSGCVNHAHGVVDRPLVLLLHRVLFSIERVAV